jgi:exo-beta-1,3-glucanase (GH17 family)
MRARRWYDAPRVLVGIFVDMSKPSLVFVAVSLLVLALVAGFWHQTGQAVQLPEITSASHKLQCVSYSPFGKDQSPLVKGFVIRNSQLDIDLELLSKYFSCIRTYSMTGLEELPLYAKKHGLQLMLGAWVSSDAVDTRIEIEKLVQAANAYPDVVQSVIVGNEALLRKDISGTRLAELITSVKARVQQPVTYADVWEFWLKHPQVAPAVDFITIHLLPYWENDPTGIDEALTHVAAVREEFGREFAPKKILIGETGWPSEGRQRETAVPSRLNQAKFVRGFVMMAEKNGWDYNLIEAFDQPWKRINEGAVGGYWGLFDADRIDKQILAGAISNLPQWGDYLTLSVAVTLCFLGLTGLPDSTRGALLAPVLAGIAGICIALWMKQAMFDNRNMWEWVWTGVLLLLNIVVIAHGCLALSLQKSAWRRSVATVLEKRAGALLLIWGFIVAVMMMQLVFDSRYRQFPAFVLLCPALVFLCWPVVTRSVRELRLLAAVLGIGIPLQLTQEMLTNTQALGWAGACMLLTAALWRSSRINLSAHNSNAKAAIVTV